jgi:hypothetical protein
MERISYQCDGMSIETDRDFGNEETERYGNHSLKACFTRHFKVMMAHFAVKDPNRKRKKSRSS